MARTTPRPAPTETQLLPPLQRYCPPCGETMGAAYPNYRTLTTLEAVLALTLHMRRCLNRSCPPFRPPYRPEPAGRLALPQPACGLDVIARLGQWRYADHRRLPAISLAVRARPGAVAPRTGTPLLARYDALGARSLQDLSRLQRLTPARGRVIFALDGRQPAGGHAGLWGWRDGLSGAGLLARRFLSAPHEALAHLVQEGPQALPVPRVGGIRDGHPSLRVAVAQALPGVPHPLGHCHALREAAQPISEAERQAKKTLKKRVRGMRPSARPLAGRPEPPAEVRRGSCRAVRRALTKEGRPPLAASGRTRHDRRTAIADRLERVEQRGPGPRPARA